MIRLRADQAIDLTPAEVDENWISIYRASVLVQIDASGAITIPGSGRYKVLPNTGTADDLTSIVLTGENVEGTLIQLRPNTTGHTITLVHGATLKLPNVGNAVLPTIYSSIWLRHYGSAVWVAESTVLYTA